jgi:Flp pilus assembly pilin Flp
VRRFRKVLKNQKGQGMLEYVLLLAIVAGLVMAFKTQISGIFNQATSSLSSSTSQVFSNGQ